MARSARVIAVAVLRPADTEQVRTVVGLGTAPRRPPRPPGREHRPGRARPPRRRAAPRSVLSLARLAARRVIDPVDRTAVVDAGRPPVDAQRRRRGPRAVPADRPGCGPDARRHGGDQHRRVPDAAPRRHAPLACSGSRAVLADEGCSVVDELTTLRKHNIGPSLGQLLIGAGGAFGVITRSPSSSSPVAEDRCVRLARAELRAVGDRCAGAPGARRRGRPECVRGRLRCRAGRSLRASLGRRAALRRPGRARRTAC